MEWENRARIDKDADIKSVLLQYGQDIMRDPRYLPLASFKQHHGSNTLRHCVLVALNCLKYAQKMHIKVDAKSLVRGALLHDYYLYQYTLVRRKGHLTHHGQWAMHNAMVAFGLNQLERNMIYCHMWPFRFFSWPKSREAWILCLQDKVVCFKEVFDSYLRPKKISDPIF